MMVLGSDVFLVYVTFLINCDPAQTTVDVYHAITDFDSEFLPPPNLQGAYLYTPYSSPNLLPITCTVHTKNVPQRFKVGSALHIFRFWYRGSLIKFTFGNLLKYVPPSFRVSICVFACPLVTRLASTFGISLHHVLTSSCLSLSLLACSMGPSASQTAKTLGTIPTSVCCNICLSNRSPGRSVTLFLLFLFQNHPT